MSKVIIAKLSTDGRTVFILEIDDEGYPYVTHLDRGYDLELETEAKE